MTNKKNLGIGGIIVLLIAAYLGLDLSGHKSNPTPSSSIPAKQRTETTFSNDGVDTIKAAYERRQSNVQVQGSGRVKACLLYTSPSPRDQQI
ncbi:hypothetical protein ACMZ5D_05900, partial [Acinetobacter baumannii]